MQEQSYQSSCSSETTDADSSSYDGRRDSSDTITDQTSRDHRVHGQPLESLLGRRHTGLEEKMPKPPRDMGTQEAEKVRSQVDPCTCEI